MRGMAELSLSISGLAGVLVGYALFRRRPKPVYVPAIANTAPPADLTPITSYGVSCAQALAGAEQGMRLIREASD